VSTPVTPAATPPVAPAPRGGGGRRRSLPLRVTLVLALVSLVALGLLASGFAATTQLAGFLRDRTDSQLVQASHIPPSRLGKQGGGLPPSRYYVGYTLAGASTVTDYSDTGDFGRAQPVLPAPGPDRTSADPRPYTVTAADGSPWRAISVSGYVTSTGATAVLTTAISLSDDRAAITRLTELLLVIGAVVLVLLGGLTYLVVRRSLRPLTEVEATAAAIAAGDLDRRVPEGGPGTEVGRLSLALNGMLTQIQTAFDASAESARRATSSEHKMRRFVGDASHELRTPLTTIRGFAELYRQGAAADPAAVARIMGRIEGESQRMGLLVEDLLLLARLDAQRPLEHAPVDLLTLASDAVHDARAVAPGRAVRLEVLDGPGVPEVLGDEGRLRQVLGNLVTNALSHTPAGALVTVRVGTLDSPTGAAEAVLEVADTGPGLQPGDAERVFERFYRADTSRTRASGGTGLGLSIVAALVAAHGGTVGVSSAPGAGATFTVRLPQVSTGAAARGEPAHR
jgi:two-component system OmpR family sensor kinase